jgi:hypothetical protein
MTMDSLAVVDEETLERFYRGLLPLSVEVEDERRLRRLFFTTVRIGISSSSILLFVGGDMICSS